ncbi:hybrid sensor histidine kinase/response regulator [Kordiimonas marina]|uniref:hybrid sensor histidine kinase/response regulator n=1 Tax=Kordiimonas marina TaxID=2872312 RepID=UPI001FF320CF|nr:hybrid sensor histidine kinase/response regulator [Kordiimonas marina]MCJ9429572.1 hybrid sensor histidine kinase/response regulator [Kordiimonas marina]
MDDLLNEFLTETGESIDVVDVELVKLEQDPNNKEVLDNIFRLVHTIKGTCGFLGLPRLESVAHASENVLGKFRDGELQVSEHSVTVILESLDRIKEILAGLEATEEEPEGDDTDLIARLDAIAEGKDAAPAPEPDTIEGEIIDPGLGRVLKPGEVSLAELEAAFANAPGPDEADEAAPAPSAAGTSGAQKSLFERVGGEDTLAVAAHLLAQRLEKHQELGKFFASVDAEQRKGRFMGLMLALYKDDLDAADNVGRQLVTVSGFSEQNFNTLIGLVKDVLVECQVDGDTADEAVMSFELVREAVLSASKAITKAETNKAGREAKSGEQAAAGGESGKRVSQSIRVNVDLLEELMNLVSELVLTRNQLLQITRNVENSELGVPLQRLSQCTTELQESVMKTRMQPIGNAWAKLPRIVRDLTVELDKKIELEMLGADTELDRQVLELIKDPLTHMVRNSADHGIETPAERIALGKDEGGTITLNAYHEGGHIIIEIKDDGRGISVSKLSKKILEKRLATEAELAEMSDAQIQKFIFHPGFSTAEQITSVSGRGVGMDVVRSNIEKIGGTIDMQSVEGKGSRFAIKIPLTLAIVAGLIVKAQDERYAIPQISVLELVRAAQNSEHKIETIKNTPVLRLRNRLLPLVYLNEILGFMTREEIDARDNKDDFIVVAQVGTFTFGIVVDQVFDTEEIVVKPVAPILKDLEIYSGNTILGDGSVIMILDPNGIAALANSSAGDHEHEEEKAHEEAKKRTVQDEKESMLLFRAGGTNPRAVPLGLVARLEEIDISSVEQSDGRLMVQYRGALMPLILADDNMALKEDGRQPVLVFTDREYTMGLAVDEILDIVEDKLDIKLASDRPGVVGSAVIAGKASEVIDVAHFLSLAFADWLKSRDMADDVAPSRGVSLLLIDDSDFFRNMLKPVLTVAGYEVKAVSSAAVALRLMEEGYMFDMVISDIEMPDMNGFDFAREIRDGSRWAELPLIALSALATERDIARGHEAGFDDYVAKFDKETLLRSLSQQLKIKGDAA